MISEIFYNEIIKYTKIRLNYKLIFDFNCLDIVHNVILDTQFQEEGWRKLVDKYIFEEIKFAKLKGFFEKDKWILEENRRCTSCDEDYPISWYHLSFRICDSCYRLKNYERIKEVNLRSYLKHHEKRKEEKRNNDKKKRAENRELIRQKDREYYAKNKEKILAKNKKCYLKNIEKRKAYLKEYHKKKSKPDEENNI